jgi:phosphatidylserine decarboxylase
VKLHKEGYGIILTALVLFLSFEYLIYHIFFQNISSVLFYILISIPLALFILIVQFFRVPKRSFSYEIDKVLCPADGKVVVIEEVDEIEYFKDRRIQISIFMSPLNVHANFNPVSGTIQYAKYHPGLFLVAWHPKSSTDNERTTFVTKTDNGKKILFRQIAGALARRICYYVKEGQEVHAGEEFGFIKFGSRIDVFLPLDAKIKVSLNQKVKGQLTTIAEI